MSQRRSAPLVGRGSQTLRIRTALDRLSTGRGSLLLVTGEPGIGKSYLAEYAANQALAAGCSVGWGRCWEAGGAPPFWPWTQICRDLGVSEDVLLTTAGSLDDDEQTRFRVFQKAVSLIAERSLRNPLVLVLDDLHASDVPSVLLLLLLAQRLEQIRVLVLAAYRDARARAREVGVLLGKLSQHGESLALPRLDLEDVAAWLSHVSPSVPEDMAAKLHRITEGHPLFIAETLEVSQGCTEEPSIEGLSNVLAAHLGRLQPRTRKVLEVAAIFGREVCAGEIAAIAGLSDDEVAHCLREAISESILVPLRQPEQYRFSHMLLRDRLYLDLRPSQRAALHWEAGSLLAARKQGMQAVADHLLLGYTAGAPELAAAMALRAAREALAQLAFEEAANFALRGLAVLTDFPRSVLEGELRLVLAEARIRTGDSASGRSGSLDVAALARELSVSSLLARAALVYASDYATAQVDPAMVTLLREALRVLPEASSPLRARLMARLASALMPPATESDLDQVLEIIRRAISMARELGDPATNLHVMQHAATAALPLLGDEERLPMLEQGVVLARELKQPLSFCAIAPGLIGGLLGSGRRPEAEQVFREYQSMADALGAASQPWRIPLMRALFHAHAGEFDAAEGENARAGQLAKESNSRVGLRLWASQQVNLATLHGHWETIARNAPELSLILRSLSGAPYEAWILAASGQREQATALLRARSINPAFFPGVCLAGEACAVLRDVSLAAEYYPMLKRFDGRMFWSGTWIVGPASRVLGHLARVMGRWQDANQHYRDAIAHAERIGAAGISESCRRESKDCEDRIGKTETRRSPKPAKGSSVLDATDLTLRREGQLWILEYGRGNALRLIDEKGVGYLNLLVQQPGRAVHVLELLGAEHRGGDAGPVLDATAKRQYRSRLVALRAEFEHARDSADLGRAEKISEEIEVLSKMIRGAVGLGGRDRRASSEVERARINVQRRLKQTVRRVASGDPALGRYLSATVRTGTYCVYQPL